MTGVQTCALRSYEYCRIIQKIEGGHFIKSNYFLYFIPNNFFKKIFACSPYPYARSAQATTYIGPTIIGPQFACFHFFIYFLFSLYLSFLRASVDNVNLHDKDLIRQVFINLSSRFKKKYL